MFNRASHYYAAIVVVLLGIATLIRVADPFFVQALRLIAFDSYQLINPAEYDPNMPVRLIDIDEDSLEKIGQWPWSRVEMAELLNRLTEQGAAVVAFDILFSEPDRTSPEQAMSLLTPEEQATLGPVLAGKPSHDAIFAEAIANSPAILATALTERPSPPPPLKAGFAVAGDPPTGFLPTFQGATRNLSILDDAAPAIGSINWIPDRDQVVRRLPLVYQIGDQYVPTLVTEALRLLQGAGTYVLKGSNASNETAFGEHRGLNHVRVGAFELPTDSSGALWLKFRKAQPQTYIPAWKVLAGENDPNDIAGMITIIGTSAPGLLDLRATPLDASIPGFEVHAQALEQIFREISVGGAMVTRYDFAGAIEIVVMILVGLLLAFILPRLGAIAGALTGVAAIAVVVLGGNALYARYGLLFDTSYIALVMFVLVTVVTIYVYRRSEQQKGEVRKAFSYYVSPAVVNEIVKNPDKLELGGEVRELSLLFCDVRNFTSISERMSAHELTRFINNLLTPLSEIILTNRGTIDKYMGDAIMAFWNAPLDDPNHADNALNSALTMIRRMEDLNAAWRKEAEAAGKEYMNVAIGIGINSGNCCVGNLGSSQRFDYSAIGDDVNVASRYEGLSKTYGVPIVLGEPTVKRIAALKTIELDLMRVKGRAQPTRIYTAFDVLAGANGQYDEVLARHTAMLDLYRSRDWDGADAAIASCEAFGVKGLTGLYSVYRGRIAEWRANPPPPDWDGAYTATSK